MEFRQRPLGFMEFFLQNNNHLAVKKIFLTARWLLFCKKLHETQGSLSKFHELDISNIYLFIIIIIT